MTFPKTLLLSTALCAALAACGGGGSGDGVAAAPGPIVPVAPAAATLADCFGVTSGVAYTMTDPDGGTPNGVRMLEEPFGNGPTRGAMVELAGTSDVRTSATYWSHEADAIRFWGLLLYDVTGAAQTRVEHSAGFTLPLGLLAGQASPMVYTDTVTTLTGAGAGQTEAIDRQETWTFEGFESLTLGGHTFTDSCRIKVTEPGNTADGPSTLWFAKGFGIVKIRHTNAAGTVVAESAVASVTAAPQQ